ncbi:hypothetical protein MSAN_01504400 [Mycena sanguinolenta]|uniref:Uncharacterized protein n=1 Tax=Mycena sanguinolenta TaxID=230812 RepID=A0A8H6Y4L1_9AGAR|nr:hypothetical protein MSAN_01504400 [Mycena sanguinolenta]
MVDCIPPNAFSFDSPFRLVDFQGHVLNLANGVNPVISQTKSTNGSMEEQWVLQQSGLGGPGGELLVSALPGFPTVAYDFNLSPNPGPLSMQAISGDGTTTFFQINCLDSTRANFIDVVSSLALTAWAAESGSTISPVTFETFTNRSQQVWSFEALD